jgi:hypothetical protein
MSRFAVRLFSGVRPSIERKVAVSLGWMSWLMPKMTWFPP